MSNSFSYGTRRAAYNGIGNCVYDRIRNFLAKRRKVQGRSAQRFSYVVHGELGVRTSDHKYFRAPSSTPPWIVGEPDAGNPHVRFDKRGWGTERCHLVEATVPILDSVQMFQGF